MYDILYYILAVIIVIIRAYKLNSTPKQTCDMLQIRN